MKVSEKSLELNVGAEVLVPLFFEKSVPTAVDCLQL